MGEIIQYNSCNSTTSCSSVSSYSQGSIKRTDSNDAVFPPSKSRHLPGNGKCSTSFTSFTSFRSETEPSSKSIPQSAKRADERVRSRHSSPGTTSGCISCNCRRSHCLKLYCECFKNQGYCNSECNCLSCYNNHRHEEEREEVIQQMLSRDPHVFDSHVDKKVEMDCLVDV